MNWFRKNGAADRIPVFQAAFRMLPSILHSPIQYFYSYILFNRISPCIQYCVSVYISNDPFVQLMFQGNQTIIFAIACSSRDKLLGGSQCKTSYASADKARKMVTTAPARTGSHTSSPSSQPSTSFKSGRTPSTINNLPVFEAPAFDFNLPYNLTSLYLAARWSSTIQRRDDLPPANCYR